YHPQTEGGKPIYVHSKLMIIDDACLRVGSSNINNRSMRLDSECDVILSDELNAGLPVGDMIRALRTRLLAEHLGVTPATVRAEFAARGSLIDTIEALRG